MTKKIPIEQMDEFCDRLFRALDRADLLPLRLNEAAHSFEKYGRLLAGLISRYDKIEAAFDEWQTRALRGIKSQSRREELYPYFQELRDWLTNEENRQLFEGDGRKDNLNHFKRSLYARVYTWLYPRRKLAVAYADIYRGDGSQFEPAALEHQFGPAVQGTLAKLSGANEQTVNDARAYTSMKKAYYSHRRDEQNLAEEDESEIQDLI